MNTKYNELREKYPEFIYEKYEIEKNEEKYVITYFFQITNLVTFTPKLEISKKCIHKLDEISKYIIFNIGLIELISYWKSTCSKNVIIKAGYINQEQIEWFKKLYYYGLGELFYKNNIKTSIEDFMNISCMREQENIKEIDYEGIGNLIPIGGGKDSCVTLELLKEEKEHNSCFMINPKIPMIECATIAGYNEILSVNRILDRKIIELNEKGFINGHTPFSSLVAFISYLLAYENNKKNIILSNESSANEETIIGTKINHQYSKTYEFENDFNNYITKYFKINIKYFSLLRPLKEIQIANLFSHYEKYHKIFRSCNLGSKSKEWNWCCNCPKCLFIFIILSPFLYKEKLISIFKEDLFEKKELFEDFKSLIGENESKPFECVGSIEEVKYALNEIIGKLTEQQEKLPFLLEYYKKYYTKNNNFDILIEIDSTHNLDNKYLSLLIDEVNKNVQ